MGPLSDALNRIKRWRLLKKYERVDTNETSTSILQPSETKAKCYQISLKTFVFLAVCVGALVLCREYLGVFMTWFSHLSGWYGPILFGLLYIPISLPMMWGYLVLNIGGGYLYGFYIGSVVTAIGASVGALISFVVCQLLWKDYVTRKLSTFENLQQLVKVIEGRQGFRIIMMTRLTPIPFGLQNAMLSAAKITKLRFTVATFLGLLPTQMLNTYMGTSLRSIEDVLAGNSTSTLVLVLQIIFSIVVTFVVNALMKEEVRKACEREAAEHTLLDSLGEARETAPRLTAEALPLAALNAGRLGGTGSLVQLDSVVVESLSPARTVELLSNTPPSSRSSLSSVHVRETSFMAGYPGLSEYVLTPAVAL